MAENAFPVAYMADASATIDVATTMFPYAVNGGGHPGYVADASATIDEAA